MSYDVFDSDDAELGEAMRALYDSGASTPPYVPQDSGRPWYDTAASVIGGVASGALSFMKARDEYRAGAASARTDAELARIREQGLIARETLKTQTEAARLRNELTYAQRGFQAPSLGGMFYGTGGSGGGYSTIMLMLTAAGVYLAWRALKR